MSNRPNGLSATLFALAASLVPVGSVSAADGEGCVAVNRGALNGQLSAGSSLRKSVSLDAGDLLTFTADAASVSVSGGPDGLATLVDGSSSDTATFRSAVAGTYTFKLATSADAAGAVRASCVSTTTEAANAAFLERRKALLNSRDPDRLRIDRAPTPIINAEKPLSSSVSIGENGRAKDVGFSVSLSEIAAAANGNKKIDPGIVDFWLEGRMQTYDAALDTGNNLSVLYMGTRSMLSPDIMVGALAQLDRGVESFRDSTPDMAARGWMVGPYTSVKVGSGVVFDARAAWGETENAVSSGAIDDTLTQRKLIRSKLTGTREFGGWKVAPSVGLVYVEDAVRDSASNETRAAGNGKVEVLPEVSKRFALDDSTFIEPRAALGAFVGFDDLQALNPSATAIRPTDVQLKAEAGVAVGVKDGTSLEAKGGVESGAANSAAGNWMGRLQLNVPLGN